jgi:hypothetical protein
MARRPKAVTDRPPTRGRLLRIRSITATTWGQEAWPAGESGVASRVGDAPADRSGRLVELDARGGLLQAGARGCARTQQHATASLAVQADGGDAGPAYVVQPAAEIAPGHGGSS